MDCEPTLYPCNRWECNRCFSKRAYWLREQAISFVFELPVNRVFFTVLKHFKNASECHDMMEFIIKREKSLKTACSGKFEYFYVIANHGFSGWHIHIISNRNFENQAQYSKRAKSRKASALYMVENLEMSRSAEYGRIRRYSASRLLYKQNKKSWFKTRVKLWLQRFVEMVVGNIIRMLVQCHRSVMVKVVTSASVTSATPYQNDVVPPVERPPPRPIVMVAITGNIPSTGEQ